MLLDLRRWKPRTCGLTHGAFRRQATSGASRERKPRANASTDAARSPRLGGVPRSTVSRTLDPPMSLVHCPAWPTRIIQDEPFGDVVERELRRAGASRAFALTSRT